MKNPITLMKRSASNFLRDAAAKIMHSYEEYLTHDRTYDEGEHALDPKNFKAFHDAGKSAATHLETVLKIGTAADVKKGEEDQTPTLEKEYEAVQMQIRHLHKGKFEKNCTQNPR